MPVKNHLIVGIGGTGGQVICELRKIIYEEYRSHQTPRDEKHPKYSLDSKDLNIGYLYVDTSTSMMNGGDMWTTLGEDVDIANRSKVKIGSDTNMIDDILNNPMKYPNITPWIGDGKVLRDFARIGAGTKAAGGQIRGMGRRDVAFNKDVFLKQLKTNVQDITKNNKDVCFHVCCGIAGGTGSGTLIDIIAQIRSTYPPSEGCSYTILLYLYLPENPPLAGRDVDGRYHANAYAALVELNALALNWYIPYNIARDGYHQPERLSKPDNWFKGAYIFENTNENGNVLNVETEVPRLVADFIFQKNIATPSTSLIERIERIENYENDVLNLAEKTNIGSQSFEKSCRFLVFGQKRIVVPIDEIREHLTYSQMEACILQMWYNNWQDGRGYLAEKRNLNLDEELTKNNIDEAWHITSEHLELQKTIISNSTERWQFIRNHWQNISTHFKDLVQKEARTVWLDKLDGLNQEHFEQNFRNVGVNKFYKNKAEGKDKIDLANEIVRVHIEKDIFTKFGGGANSESLSSIFDIKRALEKKQADLLERRSNADDKIAKNVTKEKDALTKLKEIREEFNKIGPATDFVISSKRVRVLESYVQYSNELYIARTLQVACAFSKILIDEVRNQLAVLQQEINKLNTELGTLYNRVLDKKATTCQNEVEAEKNKKAIVRLYQPEEIRTLSSTLYRMPTIQTTYSSNIRKNIVEFKKTFRELNFNFDNFLKINDTQLSGIEGNFKDYAELRSLVENLNPDIITKLQELFRADKDKLKRFIKDMLDNAKYYTVFNPKHRFVNQKERWIIRMPNYDEYKNDPNHPIHELTNLFKDGTQIELDFFDAGNKINEITIFSFAMQFPLRSIEKVSILKTKYDNYMAAHHSMGEHVLIHSEDFKEPLPPLFDPTEDTIAQQTTKMREAAIADILLGKALGLIKEKKDNNGYDKQAFGKIDVIGDFEIVFFMDKRLSEAYKNLSIEQCKQLNEAVISKLKEPIYQNLNEKLKLVNSLTELLKFIRDVEKAGNDQDPDYLKYKNAGLPIIINLKKDA